MFVTKDDSMFVKYECPQPVPSHVNCNYCKGTSSVVRPLGWAGPHED